MDIQLSSLLSPSVSFKHLKESAYLDFSLSDEIRFFEEKSTKSQPFIWWSSIELQILFSGIFKSSCQIDITWFPFDDQAEWATEFVGAFRNKKGSIIEKGSFVATFVPDNTPIYKSMCSFLVWVGWLKTWSWRLVSIQPMRVQTAGLPCTVIISLSE